MRDRPTGGQSQAVEVIAPSACPACRSSDIKTTSKIVTAQAYWRCVACGEVWNVRRRGATRQSAFDPFRR
jgi:transposase-like protein